MLEKELKKKLEGVPVKEIIHTENYGDVIVYDDYSREDYKYSVEFKNTGYIIRAVPTEVRRNGIKDKLYKHMLGVACIGYASMRDNYEAYLSWRHMIRKCYNPNYKAYSRYGALGYTVCDRWLRFDEFLKDYEKYDKPIASSHLNIKPELVKAGVKLFSPENCTLIKDFVEYDPNEIHHTKNSGDFKIIGREYNKNGILKYLVEFILTGYTTLISSKQIKSGEIYDPYYPRVCGIGYMGNATRVGNEIEYRIWAAMMHRCYNKKSTMYEYYGGSGVTVDPRWHSFENFLHDFKQMKNYDLWKAHPGEYHLDKDKLQMYIPKNQKVYSKDTCSIISAEENSMIHHMEKIQNTNNNYYGLYKISSGWFTRITHDKIRKNLGVFDNEIAAANARDWWAKYYGHLLLNSNLGLPYMPPEEWVLHRILPNNEEHKQMYTLKPRQLYHLIDKEEDGNKNGEGNNEG